MLKLWCNKRSVYTERPTFLSSKRRPYSETCAHLGENKNLGHGSQTEGGMFVLNTRPLITDWQIVNSRKAQRMMRRFWRLLEPSDSKVWSRVPWGWGRRITKLVRTNSNLAVCQTIWFIKFHWCIHSIDLCNCSTHKILYVCSVVTDMFGKCNWARLFYSYRLSINPITNPK
jgi:hypothetical protein